MENRKKITSAIITRRVTTVWFKVIQRKRSYNFDVRFMSVLAGDTFPFSISLVKLETGNKLISF